MDKFVPYNNCKAVCYVDGEYMVKRVEIYFVLTYHIIYKNGTFSLFYDRLSKITYCLLNYFFKANLQIPFCSPLASELKMVAKIPQIDACYGCSGPKSLLNQAVPVAIVHLSLQ